jgi:predicted Zn-dependent protease
LTPTCAYEGVEAKTMTTNGTDAATAGTKNAATYNFEVEVIVEVDDMADFNAAVAKATPVAWARFAPLKHEADRVETVYPLALYRGVRSYRVVFGVVMRYP